MVGDVLLLTLRPVLARTGALRGFATGLPLATFSACILYLVGNEGTSWPTHVWLGTMALAGISGLIVSLLVAPPRAPATSEIADWDPQHSPRADRPRLPR